MNCYACSRELEPEFRGDVDCTYQFDNALWLKLSGGYGMFIDPFTEKDPEVVICHNCAHELCDAVPWIKTLIDPVHSHSHRDGTVARGHVGWDFDNCCDEHRGRDHPRGTPFVYSDDPVPTIGSRAFAESLGLDPAFLDDPNA